MSSCISTDRQDLQCHLGSSASTSPSSSSTRSYYLKCQLSSIFSLLSYLLHLNASAITKERTPKNKLNALPLIFKLLRRTSSYAAREEAPHGCARSLSPLHWGHNQGEMHFNMSHKFVRIEAQSALEILSALLHLHKLHREPQERWLSVCLSVCLPLCLAVQSACCCPCLSLCFFNCVHKFGKFDNYAH